MSTVGVVVAWIAGAVGIYGSLVVVFSIREVLREGRCPYCRSLKTKPLTKVLRECRQCVRVFGKDSRPSLPHPEIGIDELRLKDVSVFEEATGEWKSGRADDGLGMALLLVRGLLLAGSGKGRLVLQLKRESGIVVDCEAVPGPRSPDTLVAINIIRR